MKPPRTSLLRFLRAAALALVIIVLATSAHAVAGGQLPPAWLAISLGVLTLWATILVTRWRLGFIPLAGLLAAGQFALHHGLMMAPVHCAGPLGAAGQGAGHDAGHHAAGHALAGLSTAGGAPASAVELISSCGDATSSGHTADLSLSMFLMHGAATLLAALALGSGERTLWRLWLWLITDLPALDGATQPTPITPAARFPEPEFRVIDVVHLLTSPHRGPPPGLAA
ncbi:hypothetical protein LWF01_18585 [Saxibacter everestensis]|uniref:Uncharacterized protein n=1 Tax=Saxibacter everestensis TaxID=2909229 RepID=A0ABY8QT24_9MICO|nr:hypothetical protein LWF01_18585 [Brevibacteriaceae bacterium ZFBP1038]